MEGKLDKFTITVGDTISNRTRRQKINEDIEELNNIINRRTGIYRTLYPTTEKHICQVHMEYPSSRPYPVYKINISKCKIIEIIQSIFLTIMELNWKSVTRKITGKSQISWKSNNILIRISQGSLKNN